MSEFKNKWLAALRSGEYTQARYKLKDSRGYCCLGVGAAVAGEEFVECKPTSLDPEKNPIFKLVSTGMDTVYAGPNGELNKVKVTNPIDRRSDNYLVTMLTVLNDREKWTFKQIADWLETIDF